MYNLRFFVSCLAHKVKSESAQRAFVASKWDSKMIMDNPNLNEKLWEELFKNCKVEHAYALIKPKLTDKQLRLALKDKRKTVKYNLFSDRSNSFSDDITLEILNSKWFDQTYAKMWLKSGTVPDNFLKDVGIIENSIELSKLLADKKIFSLAEAKKYSLGMKVTSYSQLPRLVDLRPQLIPTFIKSGKPLFVLGVASSQWLSKEKDFENIFSYLASVVAGSKLTSYDRLTIATLLGNPNTPYSMIEKIVDLNVKLSPSHDSRLNFNLHAYKNRITNFGKDDISKGDWTKEKESKYYPHIQEYVKYNGGFSYYPTLEETSNSNPNQYGNQCVNFGNQTSDKENQKFDFDATFSELLKQGVPYDNRFSPLSLTQDVMERLEEAIGKNDQLAWDLFWMLIENHEGSLNDLISLTATLNM